MLACSVRALQETEARILYLLSNSQGNFLDDEDLIDVLSQSKATSEEVTKKVD
jgi:dynein heavy chain